MRSECEVQCTCGRGEDSEAAEAGLEEHSNEARGRFEAVTRRTERPLVGCT